MRSALLGLALVLGAASLSAQSYKIDPMHTEVGFEVVHMTLSHVRGNFAKFSGTVDLDEHNLEKSKVSLDVDASSVNTRVGMRDKDLRSDHFFDVAKTPDITFESTKVAKTADGYALSGNLTIHGITKPVTLDATLTDPVNVGPMMGGVRRGFSLRGSIHRLDYKVGPGNTMMISDKVELMVDGELIKQSDVAAQ
ncbi:MAG TPA: YceI family protein [bacterium]|jgi:polyisoprenoid-binding protein YceI|nr:YceI family protein [bacterium]